MKSSALDTPSHKHHKLNSSHCMIPIRPLYLPQPHPCAPLTAPKTLTKVSVSKLATSPTCCPATFQGISLACDQPCAPDHSRPSTQRLLPSQLQIRSWSPTGLQVQHGKETRQTWSARAAATTATLQSIDPRPAAQPVANQVMDVLSALSAFCLRMTVTWPQPLGRECKYSTDTGGARTPHLRR